jgi:hypothetical protein
VSKDTLDLRGFRQRLRGEEKHAELGCHRNTVVCIRHGISIFNKTQHDTSGQVAEDAVKRFAAE